jgi:hypothetical protein
METNTLLQTIGKLYVENDRLRSIVEHLNKQLQIVNKDKEELQSQLLLATGASDGSPSKG